MGNRALITTDRASLGIYLHWNGGHDSVTAFLRYAELVGLPKLDQYGSGFVALGTVIANYFGNSGLSIDIVPVDPGKPGAGSYFDNGVYIIDGYRIAGRINAPGYEQNNHDLDEMLTEIDQAQPVRDRLGGFLTAREAPMSAVKIGQQVWVRDHFGRSGRYVIKTVLGIGDNSMVNGRRWNGVPYVDMYENQDNQKNPNAYLAGDTVRIVEAAPVAKTAELVAA